MIHIAWRVDTKRFTALNLRLYYLTWPRVFTGLQKIDVAAFLTSHFDNAMKYCNVACLWIFMPSLSTMHCDNYSNTATAPSWTRAQFSYGYCWCPSWPWCFPHFQWPHTVGSNGLGVYPLPELKVATCINAVWRVIFLPWHLHSDQSSSVLVTCLGTL